MGKPRGFAYMKANDPNRLKQVTSGGGKAERKNGLSRTKQEPLEAGDELETILDSVWEAGRTDDWSPIKARRAKAALIEWSNKRLLREAERAVSKLRMEYANTPLTHRTNGWDWLGKVTDAIKQSLKKGGR